ncbi:MAG: thiol-disulfide isomerase [Acidobacteria bacterium]|nr:MAG: thiol-disulfide isomerase [Acidobacteriota bacterium]
MVRLWVVGLIIASAAIAAAEATAQSTVTFNKDVLPILQNNCQSCHRPGQVAPMSLLTYKDVRPWAKAIKAATVARKMPPWNADPRYGHYTNDRSLKQSAIDTLTKWVDAGAPEGDPNDAPAPKQWPSGDWEVEPDIILDGPDFDVPATGVVDWFWVAIPSHFTRDTWITSMQFQPVDPAVVHHIGITFVPHTPDVKYNEPIWERIQRDADLITVPGQPFQQTVVTRLGLGGREQDTYVPGHTISDYRPYNAARLIPANTDIYLNLHYTPNGTPIRTHVKIGFTVAKDPPKHQVLMVMVSGATDREHFRIPANDGNWAAPVGEATFVRDVEIISMMPHMHVRGKSMTYTLTYPDGKVEKILDVPHYDFNWQLKYDTSVKVPKGSKLRVDAHYDNSANNKYNPNPNRDVYYGEQTWEEMMIGYVGVLVDDPKLDPRQLFESIRR